MMPSVSIDLAREVTNIAARQHLNAVHDVVVLVRRALRAGATEVRITTSARALTIEHDGASFPDDERELLFVVLDETRPAEARQEALTKLERDHGVALLSLLVTKPDVRLESTRSFIGGDGRIHHSRDTRTPGWRLTYARPRAQRGAERRELAFYCQHTDAKIIIDGRRLATTAARSLLPRRALARVRLDYPAESIILALLDDARVRRVRYLDHGVFFGVRTTAAERGVPVDAVFDTRDDRYDENYRGAIKRAEKALARGEREVLSSLARRNATLTDDERRRLRAIVVTLDRAAIPDEIWTTPAFPTAGGGLLSMSALAQRATARGVLFYAPTTTPDASTPRARLPILDEHEARGLAGLLDVPVRPALPAPRARPTSTTSALPPSALVGDPPPALAALVDALSDDDTRFVATVGPTTRQASDGVRRLVGVGVGDAVALELAARFVADPSLKEPIRAALIARSAGSPAGPG